MASIVSYIPVVGAVYNLITGGTYRFTFKLVMSPSATQISDFEARMKKRMPEYTELKVSYDKDSRILTIITKYIRPSGIAELSINAGARLILSHLQSAGITMADYITATEVKPVAEAIETAKATVSGIGKTMGGTISSILAPVKSLLIILGIVLILGFVAYIIVKKEVLV